MPSKIGVVFDCNVFLQALTRSGGPSAACLRLVENGFIGLYISDAILTEIVEVLNRPKVRTQFPQLTDQTVRKFVERLKTTAETISHVPEKFSYYRDVDDEPYINLAVEAKADYIISRDKDLLDLMTGYTDECKEFRQRFRPLRVIDPVTFLSEIKNY